MGAVVAVRGDCLAVGTEIRVMADCALVPNTLDVRLALLVLAERSIAVDAIVADDRGAGFWQGFVDGNEAMLRVDELGALDASGAVVPVRAVEALVADAVDELVQLACAEMNRACEQTFSHPSQTAACRTLRPSEQRKSARAVRLVSGVAALKAWPG